MDDKYIDIRIKADELNARYNDPPEPNEIEVRVLIPLPQDADHCGHGLTFGGKPSDEDVDVTTTWDSGDFSTCICCGGEFLCIGSSFWTSGGPYGISAIDSTTDRHLCSDCGGRQRRVVEGIPVDTMSFGCRTIVSTGDREPCDHNNHTRRGTNETDDFGELDPRISYKDVEICDRCKHMLKWRTVWFADLREDAE